MYKAAFWVFIAICFKLCYASFNDILKEENDFRVLQSSHLIQKPLVIEQHFSPPSQTREISEQNPPIEPPFTTSLTEAKKPLSRLNTKIRSFKRKINLPSTEVRQQNQESQRPFSLVRSSSSTRFYTTPEHLKKSSNSSSSPLATSSMNVFPQSLPMTKGSMKSKRSSRKRVLSDGDLDEEVADWALMKKDAKKVIIQLQQDTTFSEKESLKEFKETKEAPNNFSREQFFEIDLKENGGGELTMRRPSVSRSMTEPDLNGVRRQRPSRICFSSFARREPLDAHLQLPGQMQLSPPSLMEKENSNERVEIGTSLNTNSSSISSGEAIISSNRQDRTCNFPTISHTDTSARRQQIDENTLENDDSHNERRLIIIGTATTTTIRRESSDDEQLSQMNIVHSCSRRDCHYCLVL